MLPAISEAKQCPHCKAKLSLQPSKAFIPSIIFLAIAPLILRALQAPPVAYGVLTGSMLVFFIYVIFYNASYKEA